MSRVLASVARYRRMQQRKPRLMARMRWWRRFGERWYRTYPWHVTVHHLFGWTFEIGRHWRTERIYAGFWNGDRRLWLAKGGASV